MFKTAFIERFFSRKMREANVEQFINLKQGSIRSRECSLKIVKMSRHATFLISKSKNEMSRFLTGMSRFITGISRDLEDECWSAMLH